MFTLFGFKNQYSLMGGLFCGLTIVQTVKKFDDRWKVVQKEAGAHGKFKFKI
jgi:hypothetical protein